MNPALKHLAERVLVGSPAPAFARLGLRGRTLVLAYHNVLPDGRRHMGDLSLHLPRSEFARQLDVLARTHQVVPIGALSGTSPPTDRPRVVITFDDAYAGALTCGVDELVERGMPATIFVAPLLLGSVTWWDLLAERSGGVVPDDVRRNALHALGGQTRPILDRERSRPNAASPPALPQIGTESQLSQAASRPGITIGSHTWSHPNLSTIPESSLGGELSRPLQWLATRFPAVVPWLSYPYGLFTETVAHAAEGAGYQGAFRIDGGWISQPHNSRYALPRLNVPAGLSINGFRLRLAGLWT